LKFRRARYAEFADFKVCTQKSERQTYTLIAADFYSPDITPERVERMSDRTGAVGRFYGLGHAKALQARNHKELRTLERRRTGTAATSRQVGQRGRGLWNHAVLPGAVDAYDGSTRFRALLVRADI
jgi:hypothetical protein